MLYSIENYFKQHLAIFFIIIMWFNELILNVRLKLYGHSAVVYEKKCTEKRLKYTLYHIYSV